MLQPDALAIGPGHKRDVVSFTDAANLGRRLLAAVRGDSYWVGALQAQFLCVPPRASLHLAVFAEPFLQYVFDGRKTVESRFSVRRVPPYRRVAPGDVVLVKRVAGPIVGLFLVADAWFYRLDRASWSSIRREYTTALCAQDATFWEQRTSASFASLMRIARPRSIDPIEISKRDRRGWVVLTQATPPQPILPL